MTTHISIVRIISLIVGSLFVASGSLKAIDAQYFSSLIASYGFPWAGYLAPVMSGTELILGLMLILNIELRKAALLTALLTVVLTVLFGYAFFLKGIEDCGCFGSFVKIDPIVLVIKNTFIIGASALIYFKVLEEEKVETWKPWALLTIACLGFYAGGYSLSRPILNKNKIKVGDAISSSALRFFNNNLNAETGLIFIFSPDCPHCWNVTENVKSIKNISRFSNMIGVTFPESDLSHYVSSMQPNFEIYQYPTKELGQVVNEVPLLIVVQKGIIKKIYNSDEIPCGKMLDMMLNNSL